MTLTKQKNKDIIKHILENVFDLQADSELHKALSQNSLFNVASFLAFDDKDYDTLEYEKNNQRTTIKKGIAGLAKSFKAYVAYRNAIGQPFEDDNWLQITQTEFDNFKIRNVSSSSIPLALPQGPPTHATRFNM